MVGSVLFGLMMQYVMPAPLLEMAIPAMYGIEGPALLAGWALHLFHGVVLGVVYVALVQLVGVHQTATRVGGSLGLGVAYGVVTMALPVFVLPLWLSAVGFAGAPPFPNIAIPGTLVSLLGHVVYAVSLAVTYALFTSD
ncbi:histidine kinase [Halorientalis halophila]|uniref:histidine kinase n=1 Tax=Halorientalis halophila TaxID=3108499 RepID=UPI00300BB569